MGVDSLADRVAASPVVGTSVAVVEGESLMSEKRPVLYCWMEMEMGHPTDYEKLGVWHICLGLSGASGSSRVAMFKSYQVYSSEVVAKQCGCAWIEEYCSNCELRYVE